MSVVTAATATTNGVKPNKFEGDGTPFKGKLIGMEDVQVDRDEKVCLDSMFKLKAVATARGEHKQKIQLNLTMNAIKVYDDTSKIQLAVHEIERVSFVVLDPRDPRAFGYIYNTSDDRHQFWAIKTERTAATTVITLKELFDTAFEQFTNAEKAKTKENPTTPPPVSPEPVTVPQPPAGSVPVPAPQPPIPPPQTAPQLATAPTAPIFDDLWGDAPSITTSQPVQTFQQQPPSSSVDLWDLTTPATPVAPATPVVQDPLADIFGLSAPPTAAPMPTQQSALSSGTADLFSMFTPAQPTPSVNTNMFIQPTQQVPLMPQQQQPNFQNPMPISPISQPSVTKPSNEFDLLGDFS